MVTYTPRYLVMTYLAENHMSPRRVEIVVAQMGINGWIGNYIPGPHDYDREMVFLREDHPLASVFKQTQQGQEVFAKGFIESRIRTLLDDEIAGKRLAECGLAIVGVEKHTVRIRPCNPKLAKLVNTCRYRISQSGYLTDRVIQITLALRLRPRRLHLETKFQAGMMLEQFGINANDILNSNKRVKIFSPWQFQKTQTPSIPF